MWSRPVTVCEKLGLSLRVIEWSRRGVPCVLIHGFGDAACIWSHLAARLMSEFHVAAMDLRGHGDSGWDPQCRYDAKTFGDDLNRVVAALGFERVILIGHSFGAEMAIYFAANNPSRAVALVVADYGPELGKMGIDQIKTGFLEAPRQFASWQDYAGWLAAHRPLADARQVEQFARQTLRQLSPTAWQLKADPALAHSPVLNRAVTVGDRYVDPALWDAFKHITCPTLIVRGAVSGIFPDDVMRRMAGFVFGSRVATIDRAGHAVMMDTPTDFSDAVARFVSEHSGSNARKTIARRSGVKSPNQT